MAEFDIAVVGCGPSGAVAAWRLAGLGHRVALIGTGEKRRPHKLETLTPGVAELLAHLRLRGVIDWPLTGTGTGFELRWSTNSFEPRAADRQTVLVDRAPFDNSLVEAARRRDVVILRPTGVRSATRHAGSWRLACEGSSGRFELAASILVDATGRRGLLAKKRDSRYRLLAIHGVWRGEGLPTCVRIAAGERSWAWGAPTHDQAYAATVFADPHDFKSPGRTLLLRYYELVSNCGLLTDAERAEPNDLVEACDASPYINWNAVGADFIKIGEAGVAIDPISSAGVQVAIQSAVGAAACVHSLRRDPGAVRLVAEFWRDELARRSKRHGLWSARFYGEAVERFDTNFWRDRSTSQEKGTLDIVNRQPLPTATVGLRLAPALRIVEVPSIVDDVIEQRRVAICPSLAEPIAFLDGADLPTLLERILPGMTAAEVLTAWASLLHPLQATGILSWIWRRGLIEPCISGRGLSGLSFMQLPAGASAARLGINVR
jgi:flavin-dependent dehydrogenase